MGNLYTAAQCEASDEVAVVTILTGSPYINVVTGAV